MEESSPLKHFRPHWKQDLFAKPQNIKAYSVAFRCVNCGHTERLAYLYGKRAPGMLLSQHCEHCGCEANFFRPDHPN